jgi:hypothetical protein
VIDKVVQRDYVLSRAALLASSRAAARATPPRDLVADLGELDEELVAPVSEEEVAATLEALDRAAATERGKPTTLAPFDTERRGGAEAQPQEERSYFPREALTAILQSTLETYLKEEREDLLQPVERAVERRAGGGDPVPDFVLQIPTLPQVDDDRRLGGAFEITDPGWATTLLAMGWRLFRRRRDFKEEAAPPQPLDCEARVILVGDWASGHPGAQEIGALMREQVEEGARAGRQVHVIHLGDTYYSGWKLEYERNFLPFWPVNKGEEHGSWTCNGNHDMYSGGHAYFDFLLCDERFAAQARSSYFSLENEDWQLLGLDTAWEDHGLKAPQADWIDRKRADFPKRKTILLSHHQLFSEYGGGGDIEAKLGRQLLAKPVDAWFWGHEHTFTKFAPNHRGVGLARCIGHGGIPVYVDLRDVKFPAVWRDTQYFESLGGLEKWALFGFAVLDFHGKELDVTYVNEWGQKIQPETIA